MNNVKILLRDFNGSWRELAGSREDVYAELRVDAVENACDEEEIMIVSVDGMMLFNSLTMESISKEDLLGFLA